MVDGQEGTLQDSCILLVTSFEVSSQHDKCFSQRAQEPPI